MIRAQQGVLKDDSFFKLKAETPFSAVRLQQAYTE
jgi:hypothetical protein